MCDHAVVKRIDRLAASFRANEREDTMKETSDSGQEHFAAKAERRSHMFKI